MEAVNPIGNRPVEERFWTVPNVLTVVRIALTPVYLMLLFSDAWYLKVLGGLVFGIAALTDLYDGKIARAAGTTTEFGRFMDPLADKLLVSSALIAFVMMGIVQAWLVTITLVRDVAITLLRMVAIRRGNPVETSYFAKIKTMLQLIVVSGVMLALAVQVTLEAYGTGSFQLTGFGPSVVINGLVAVVTGLAVVSGLQYLVAARRAPA